MDFISKQECDELMVWAANVFDNQLLNANGRGRYFNKFSDIGNVPKLALDIKQKIMKIESLTQNDFDPVFSDFLSFNLTDASIHKHTDPNLPNRVHTRYNLLISVPESGGNPIYNGVEFKIERGMLWRCEAGKYFHESTPVIGSIPRVNISYGFQVRCR